MVWINSALARLYAELRWDKILKEQKLMIPPEETGTTLGVTQGSLAVTLGGSDTFEDKHVDDRWELHIDGEDNQSFELASHGTTTGTLRAGDEWIKATGGSKSYALVQTIFDLPEDARQVTRVQVLNTRQEVIALSPEEFDVRRARGGPTQRGVYPRFFCLRREKIQIWPHPGSNYAKLGITYKRGHSPIADAAADTVEIDWPDSLRELLQKRIKVEAGIHLGEDAPTPYPIALKEYNDSLKRMGAQDADRAHGPGPIQLSFPTMVGRRKRSFSYDGDIPEV